MLFGATYIKNNWEKNILQASNEPQFERQARLSVVAWLHLEVTSLLIPIKAFSP